MEDVFGQSQTNDGMSTLEAIAEDSSQPAHLWRPAACSELSFVSREVKDKGHELQSEHVGSTSSTPPHYQTQQSVSDSPLSVVPLVTAAMSHVLVTVPTTQLGSMGQLLSSPP